MMRKRNNFKGQVLLEYAVIIGLVVAIMMAMAPRIRRLTQGMVRVAADQVGAQTEADQFHSFNSSGNSIVDMHKPLPEDGYLVSSYSYTRAVNDKRIIEDIGTSTLNDKTYIYADNVYTNSTSLSNLGFTEEKF